MTLFVAITLSEMAKLRRQVTLRAVGIAQILGPVLILGIIRLVTSDIGSLIDPGSVVVGTVVLLAGIASVVLAAVVFGQEYDFGTVRSLLMRGAPRAMLLAAKVVAVVVAVNVIGWIALAVGFSAAAAVGWRPAGSEVGQAMLLGVSLLPLGCLAYVGASALGSTLLRSTPAGLVLGLLLFLGGFLLSTLRVQTPISEWSPVGNLLISLGGVFAQVSSITSSVGPAGAVARTLGVSLALLVSTGFLFARQDQTG
jgi:ABC-type transport system involved in multi-copper enzyme maturation permease subunit